MRKMSPALLAIAVAIAAQPADADETSVESPDIKASSPARTANPPATPRTDKPRMDASRPEPALRSYRNKSFGFQFRYPSAWQVRPSQGRDTQITVGDGRGASCNVVVVRRRYPSNSAGRPRNLDKYLATLRRQSVQSLYPAKFKANIRDFSNSKLGGQNAKRVEVGMLLNNMIPFSALQFVTYRSYGLVTLTCAARDSKFRTAAMRKYFDTVRQTFRF